MKFWRGNRYFLKIGRRNFELCSIMKDKSGNFRTYITIGSGDRKKTISCQYFHSREDARQDIENSCESCGVRPIWAEFNHFHNSLRYVSGYCLLAVVSTRREMDFVVSIYCRNAKMDHPKRRTFKTLEKSIEFVEKYIGYTEAE